MADTKELKPCPFCGVTPDWPKDGYFVSVVCECSAEGPTVEVSQQAAADAWNRRTNMTMEARGERVVPGWQTIETAPKDRRILLGKIVGHPDHPTALWWATMGEWSAKWNNWNDGIEPSGLAGPTHWQDLSTFGAALNSGGPKGSTAGASVPKSVAGETP